MSELINNRDSRATIRWKLLTSASAFVLTAYVSSTNVAKAEDADRPLIWIELGGDMNSINGQGGAFTPAFLAANPTSSVLKKVTPLQAQKPPALNFDEDGKISFQPEGSDWVFSANVRYGRSSNSREVDHQTNGVIRGYNFSGYPLLFTQADFADTQVRRQQKHAVLDFSVGKDVGLGALGRDGSSTLSLGVRFAQFSSSENFDIRARPDLHVKYYPSAHSTPARFPLKYFHTYHATGHATRSFHGVGPSLSWDGTIPFAGNAQDGEIDFDWGANAGLLFGKQIAHVRHQETGHYHSKLADANPQSAYVLTYHYPSAGHPTNGHDTDRSVTVPNVGGFAGISYQYADAKLSFGYRADLFLNAMDVGINARKSSNVLFHGPYASISIGLGD